MKAKAEGHIDTAVRLLILCAKTRCDTEYPELAFKELQVLHEQARQELEVARQLVGGEDPAAGLGELKRIVRTYYGLGPAKDAGLLQRQLEADPVFQARLKSGRLGEELKKAEALEAQAEAVAKPPEKPNPAAPAAKTPATAEGVRSPNDTRLLTPSATAVDPPPARPPGVSAATVTQTPMNEAQRRTARLGLLMDAYEIYGRIAQTGGDTAPAKKAAEARARLEKNAELMAMIKQVQAERKARELMSLADGYFRAGRLDLARQHCQKVVSEFPGTQQAADAKALLERMK
jgi:hypothetical protein